MRLGLCLGVSNSGAPLQSVTPSPPTLDSIEPATGPATGGTAVTLTGSHFRTGCSVTFDGDDAVNVIRISANTITCETPAGMAGDVDVVVTNPDTQDDTLAAAFTYVAAPQITSVTPDAGDIAGGDSVTLAGTGFQASCTVTFGGVPATGVARNSAIEVVCNTPAHAAGAVDVVLTNPDTQSDTLDDGFTYEIP